MQNGAVSSGSRAGLVRIIRGRDRAWALSTFTSSTRSHLRARSLAEVPAIAIPELMQPVD